MSRDEVIARLQAEYGYLGRGVITVSTPTGPATITYQEAGRGPDVEYMADAAMRIGHTGNPLVDAVSMLRTDLSGQSIPIAVRVDAAAVAACVRDLADASRVPAQNAHPADQAGAFGYSPASRGQGIDEGAITGAIVQNLMQTDAPSAFQAGGAFVVVDPNITDKDAGAAVVSAEKMAVDVNLTWGSAKTYKIDAGTVRSWIVFGVRTDGTYGPTADPVLARAYLSPLESVVATRAVEPTVVFDAQRNPVGVKNGKDGLGLDVDATSQAVVSYLDGLAYGATPGRAVAVVTTPIPPQVNPVSLNNLVVIGSWTTTFYPGVTNGFGANIRVPAAILNGRIVAPGQRFSFLNYVGPIDPAHGFTLGGVIQGGKSDHTGAMGGGICSASTTMFNAAARAGLEIDERHQHFYYIDRYPVGLDATVYANGGQVWDLKWTNDTPNPIVIRSWATRGSTSKITIQLMSLPLDRKVSFSPEYKANVVRASDHKVFVSSLRPGQTNRAEYPTAGFYTSRTRTVTDSTGKVIHSDTWKSHYTKVDGILQIGKPAAPVPTPPPGPGTIFPDPGAMPAASLPSAPNPIPAPRRRKLA
jgi:vancomycin resistance protein YoaR